MSQTFPCLSLERPVIITIDGPAGSGKSSVATLLADRLHFAHLDTGAMYRAVALDSLEQGTLTNPSAMAARAHSIALSFDWSKHPATILLNGRDVSELIRQPRVTEATYLAADNPDVRTPLVAQQRRIAQEASARTGGLVTEGRDQGTVVFPDAQFKFYLDAAPEERARRRLKQLSEKGIQKDLSLIHI